MTMRIASLYACLWCGLFLSVPSWSNEENFRVGPLRMSGPTDGLAGLEMDTEGALFRIFFYEERFSAKTMSGRVGLNLHLATFSCHLEGANRCSLNPLFWYMVTAIGLVGYPIPDSEGRFFDYSGLGNFLSLVLAPQLLTNWSARADILPRKVGFFGGPRTDFVVEKGRLQARPELHGGAYWSIRKAIHLDGAYVRDLRTGDERFHVRVARVYPGSPATDPSPHPPSPSPGVP